MALYEAVFSLMEACCPNTTWPASCAAQRRCAAGIDALNTYTTRDGKYLVIGANGDKHLQALHAGDRARGLRTMQRWPDNAGRVQRADELEAVIGAWAASVDLEQALTLLAGAEVPAGKIYDVADIARDVPPGARHDRAARPRAAPRSSCRVSCPS